MEGSGASQHPEPGRRRGVRVLVILGAVLGGLLLLFVGALFAAERVINSKKDEALADLSRKLGRPVSAGPIDVKLFGGGRVLLTDVVIGRDPKVPEEPDPAVRLDRAYVNAALWPIITSLGKRTVVQDVAVEGLTVQVVRFKDGRLNLQDIADRLAAEAEQELEEPRAPKEPGKPIDEETRARARGFKLERLRLADARVRLVDLQKGGAAAEVADLDVNVDNLSLVSPFQAQVTAAVLAAKKNFELKASFGQAPDRPGELPPPPLENVTIKLDPTPLAPLAPFLASALGGSGLEEATDGSLSMDFTAVPGAAVPELEGPTTLKGFLLLAGAKLAGGEPFDARLDTDVAADVPGGSADIRKLTAKLHPTSADARGGPGLADMAIDVRGKLSDLTGEKPQVDGFLIESKGLDFTRIKAFYPPLDRTAGVLLRGPFAIAARGSTEGDGAKIVGNVDLTPASIEVPGQFRKPAGTKLTLDLRAAATPNLLKAEHVALTMASWTIKAVGSLRTQGKGKGPRQSFEGTVEAPVMPVRELVALMAPKSLADVPDVRVGAKVAAKGTVGQPASMKVDVPSFTVLGGKSDLSGRLSLENLDAPKVSFEGRSKYLDIDDLLPPSAKTEKKSGAAAPTGKTATTAKTGKPAKAEEPPEMLRKLDGAAKMVVDRGRAAEIDYSNMKADLTVRGGRLTAKTLEVDALGGHFSGAGSEFPLIEKNEKFIARGEVQNLDIASALARFADKKNLLAGKLSGKIDLTGTGTEPDLLKQTLAGKLSGKLADAQFIPASLLGPIASTISEAAEKLPIGKLVRGAADKAAAVKDRRLGTLGGALRFADGAAEIVKPLEAQTPSGPLSLGGRVSLEGIADLTAKMQLSAAAASALTGGKVKFDQPVPVDLHIGGPIMKPQIRPADPAALGKVFLTALARSAAGDAIKDRAAAALESAGGAKARAQVEKAQSEAQERARAAQANASREAEEAKREAAERAEKARQEAEQRANQAKEAAGRKIRGILGR